MTLGAPVPAAPRVPSYFPFASSQEHIGGGASWAGTLVGPDGPTTHRPGQALPVLSAAQASLETKLSTPLRSLVAATEVRKMGQRQGARGSLYLLQGSERGQIHHGPSVGERNQQALIRRAALCQGGLTWRGPPPRLRSLLATKSREGNPVLFPALRWLIGGSHTGCVPPTEF